MPWLSPTACRSSWTPASAPGQRAHEATGRGTRGSGGGGTASDHPAPQLRVRRARDAPSWQHLGRESQALREFIYTRDNTHTHRQTGHTHTLRHEGRILHPSTTTARRYSTHVRLRWGAEVVYGIGCVAYVRVRQLPPRPPARARQASAVAIGALARRALNAG